VTPGPVPAGATVSPDGHWWWDGTAWQPAQAQTMAAAGMQLSPDGTMRWDGRWKRWVPYTAFSDATQLARVLALNLGAWVVLLALTMIVEVQDRGVLLDPAGTSGQLASDAGFLSTMGGLRLLLVIASGLLYLAWFDRVYGNLPALGVVDPPYRRIPALVWFFLPVANFIWLVQGPIEVWKGSDPAAGSTNQQARKRMRGSWLVLLWWLTYVAGQVLGQIAVASRAGTRAELADTRLIGLYSDAALTVAAILGSLMVLRISKRQAVKAAALRDGTLQLEPIGRSTEEGSSRRDARARTMLAVLLGFLVGFLAAVFASITVGDHVEHGSPLPAIGFFAVLGGVGFSVARATLALLRRGNQSRRADPSAAPAPPGIPQ
jgi:hypothetical protein